MSVAVTGAGVLCAIAADTDAFALALRAGRSGVTARADVGELEPPFAADLVGFDLAAAVTARADLPQPLRRAALRAAARAPLPIQAAVAVALEAWERAGLHRVSVPGHRIGIVVAGHNLSGHYTERQRPRYAASPAHLPGRFALHALDTDHVGTVSQVFGVTGEGYTVGGASASGNVAIVNAARLVATAAVDVCLVLGALTDLSPMERQAYFNLGAMAGTRGPDAPHTRSRPFDADREGFVPGQGAACLVLESADSATGRGVPPLAWVAGHALRLDANALADPSASGEAWAMATAIRRAGLTPGQVDYVNTHGTGSVLGDATEVAALHEVFGAARPWINSTKGLVGHCLCAAGVIEAVATVVQMRQGFVHPNANLHRPIDPGHRFVGRRAEPARLSFALSNGFGFGGFNTSVLFAHAGGDE
ncbi:beta-ketoacyl synthase N-terminal-like domain-containing protein [Sphaerimonospora sp. CA-214678]|uniref:beta-ketoacyl synthase N-terminal-like domain-containing protein n=1 Tax=Sphaerimonospora sp. CA-214678 TaxID=3240029 RepID=UPI003D8ED6D2